MEADGGRLKGRQQAGWREDRGRLEIGWRQAWRLTRGMIEARRRQDGGKKEAGRRQG
jgi:hypothetical protein